MQIPASPNETNTTDVLHDLPRQKARSLALNKKFTRQHALLAAPKRPTRHQKNLEIQLDHSHIRCHVGLIARRSTKPKKSSRLSRSHVPTHAACVSRSFPCTATISSCLAHPLATRIVLSAMATTDLPTEEIWLSTAVARASTRYLGFWLLLHASVEHKRAFHTPKNCC